MTLNSVPFQSFRGKKILIAVLMMSVAILLMGMDEAMAQSKNFSVVQSSVSKQISVLPKLIATIAYVIAAFFAATGLLKLKEWIHDPDKNPVNGALFRIAVASLLLVFPHVLVIANTTFFGTKSTAAGVTVSVPAQSLNAFQ